METWTKTITLFDSWDNNNVEQFQFLKSLIIEFLKQEALNPVCMKGLIKKPYTFHENEWNVQMRPRNIRIPQQSNSCDCGMFCITFVDYICYDLPFLFQAEDMNLFRSKLLGQLLDYAFEQDKAKKSTTTVYHSLSINFKCIGYHNCYVLFIRLG